MTVVVGVTRVFFYQCPSTGWCFWRRGQRTGLGHPVRAMWSHSISFAKAGKSSGPSHKAGKMVFVAIPEAYQLSWPSMSMVCRHFWPYFQVRNTFNSFVWHHTDTRTPPEAKNAPSVQSNISHISSEALWFLKILFNSIFFIDTCTK